MTTKTKRLAPETRQIREQQLRDISATGDDDNAECAASDAFKEFSGKEGI